MTVGALARYEWSKVAALHVVVRVGYGGFVGTWFFRGLVCIVEAQGGKSIALVFGARVAARSRVRNPSVYVFQPVSTTVDGSECRSAGMWVVAVEDPETCI
jgi:hypothetical protein